MAVHECAATGCDKIIPNHLLMCPSHWRMVPGPQQQRCLAAWAEMKKAWKIGYAETVAASKFLRAAQKECVDAIGYQRTEV